MDLQAASGFSVRLLGPMEVVRSGTSLPIRAAKQRVLLAALALRGGQPVLAAELIDRLWGVQPPDGARDTLRAYVMRLRKALGNAELVETVADGYRLTCGTVDVHEFRDLVRTAKRAPYLDAVRLLGDALSLWRGTPARRCAIGFTAAQ